MPDYATLVISDTSPALDEAAAHAIAFRPLKAGPITIRSVAHPQSSPLRSELTPPQLATMTLVAPGHATPLRRVTAPLNAGSIALTYNASQADLVAPGHWTCRIANATLNRIVFDTDITYPSNYELRTATCDVEFINLILAEAASLAQVYVHLQSSPAANPHENDTYVTWSSTFGALLPGQYKGTTEYRKHVDDPQPQGHNYRLVGLNASSTRVYLTSTPELVVTTTFDPQKSALKELDTIAPGVREDIDIDELVINLHIGFDGTIRPKCEAQASLQEDSAVDLALHILDDVKTWFEGGSPPNPSADAQSEFEKQISESINGMISKETVRQSLESFFVRLMRLGPPDAVGPIPHPALVAYQTKIQSYSVNDAGALVVTYYVVEQQPVVEV